MMRSQMGGRRYGEGNRGRRIPARAVFLTLAAVVIWYVCPDFAAAGKGSIIRLPMPKPAPEMASSREQKLDFFFVSQSEQRKDILSVTLVFRMKTRPAQERFADQTRVLRDEIYQFLVQQRPKKNALRYWQDFIQRNLPTRLLVKHHDIDIASVKVEQFERL